ncbi:MAG: tRNA-(ms[2]io[6]A)-hydroxylase [Pseudohongiella sp.]|nr:tRNA-(ms[2]io[6]A)-hydroxylase [Pseudohongiella sp.]
MLEELLEFLACETPDAWLEEALKQQPCLLIDHANCEKKAAATAMNLMYRHTTKPELLKKMSQLAREELLHFQQVVEILEQREITYIRLSPSRYASALRELISEKQQQQLVDTLIVGAIIEARSCERFSKLAPLLDAELEKFYTSLLKSEARHFKDYLALAKLYSDQDIGARVQEFVTREAELITGADDRFRFHSGLPV